MNSRDFSELRGKHALFSPSQSSWFRYSKEQAVEKYKNSYAQAIGTICHEFAADQIKYRKRLKKGDSMALLMKLLTSNIPEDVIDIDWLYPNIMNYVNDAISYRMQPERILYYSDKCFGTTDAIVQKGKLLRVHDLKTGRGPTDMDQLLGYAALFCFHETKKPKDLEFELRIYKNVNDNGIYIPTIETYNPNSDEIQEVMNQIIFVTKSVYEFKGADYEP